MSLQFIFGNSGSGKSDFLYDSVLKQAKENKEQQFLIIVPEQFNHADTAGTGREAKTACNHERGCAQFCKTRIPRL